MYLTLLCDAYLEHSKQYLWKTILNLLRITNRLFTLLLPRNFMNSIRAVVLRNRKLTASQSKAPAKRSQHVNATYRNIVGRNMLCSFGHHVAMCCDMLGVVGSSLKVVKFGPTTPNTSQHVATGWPNARNMLRPTMLRYVELACCDRLAGA